MIALIDYGMGNLHSVAKALERAGGRVRLVREPAGLAHAERIVLPGVGAFRDCMARLHETGMDEAIRSQIENGAPFLGICLGMQVLMSRSFEFGEHKGLGIIPGNVVRFPDDFPAGGFKIPHMGWNHVLLPDNPHPVLKALNKRQCYFVHSYYCVPDESGHALAHCDYGGIRFACAIGRDNAIGVQFHPEKSQQVGLKMLNTFLKWNP